MKRFKILRYIIEVLILLAAFSAMFLGMDDSISFERGLFYQFIFVVFIFLTSIDELILEVIFERKLLTSKISFTNIKKSLLATSIISMTLGVMLYILMPYSDFVSIKLIQLFFLLSMISSCGLMFYKIVRR